MALGQHKMNDWPGLQTFFLMLCHHSKTSQVRFGSFEWPLNLLLAFKVPKLEEHSGLYQMTSFSDQFSTHLGAVFICSI